MNDLKLLNFSEYLKELSIYTKNLIVYKAKESGKDRIHIKSFQAILARRIQGDKVYESFFNGKQSILIQLLDYFISCGEIVGLGDGYYAVLPARNVSLPGSQSILEVSQLKVNACEEANLGLAKPVMQTTDKAIQLKDYRYDLSLKDWVSVFQKSTKRIAIFNEEYYKPTKSGFRKITQPQNMVEGNLYYIISYPFMEMKEHYIARKVAQDWQGEQINGNLWKSGLALLVSEGHRPSYEVKKIDKIEGDQDIFLITLSYFLPKTEREQVNLFSLPQQLNYCKKYYVQKQYLKDFLYVLSSLEFIERDDE